MIMCMYWSLVFHWGYIFSGMMWLLTGMTSDTTRTIMCWEWRKLPSAMRAHSPVWQKTEWASWRLQPLWQSEVKHFCSLFLLQTEYTAAHIEVTDHWGSHSCTNMRFKLTVFSAGISLCKWRCSTQTSIANRYVYSLWICLIIYISKCISDTLCRPPSPVLVDYSPHVHTVTTQLAKPFHRLLVHTVSTIPFH